MTLTPAELGLFVTLMLQFIAAVFLYGRLTEKVNNHDGLLKRIIDYIWPVRG